MRSLCKLFSLALLILASHDCLAQDQTIHGFVNLVNLVPSDKPCKIHLAGEELMPDGLASARSTGWFIVPAKATSLSVQIEGFRRSSGGIEITENQSSVYVIFLEPNPRTNKNGKPIKPKIRVKRCDALPAAEKRFHLKVMSFCPGENDFLLAQNPITLSLFDSIELPKWSGGGFPITINQTPVGEVSQVSEKGSFYLFIGTDHAGRYCSVTVEADRQQLPPWMKKKG
jgi:hypothetical protein